MGFCSSCVPAQQLLPQGEPLCVLSEAEVECCKWYRWSQVWLVSGTGLLWQSCCLVLCWRGGLAPSKILVYTQITLLLLSSPHTP